MKSVLEHVDNSLANHLRVKISLPDSFMAIANQFNAFFP
jgi:hypothetical protein